MTTKKKQAPYLSQPAAAHDWAAGDAFLDDMEKQPPEQATGRAPATLRDAAVSLGQGIVSGTKMLTDVAGADNAVSRVLDGANEGLQGMYTPARKAEMQRRAQTIADADASGDKGAQVAARMGGFAEAPMQTLLQGAGSIVPTLPAMLVPGGQAVGAANIARAVGMAGVGAAQGVGSVKGSIYDEVKQALLQRGVPEAEAEQQAQAAQAYTGPNAAQIALGGGIGAVAGRVGAEGAIERLVHGAGVKRAIVPRVAGGMGAEGASEAVQGGQQQYATNSALNQAGIETDPWRGVAGAAALEGTVGAIIGGGLNAAPPGDAIRAHKVPESGPLTKAANASLEAQAQAADAGVSPAAPASVAAPAADATDPAAGKAAADAAGPAAPEAEPPIFSAQVLDVKSALAQPGAMDAVRARFGDEGAKQLLDSLAQAQNPRATESVRKKHLQAVQEGLARLNDEPLAPPEPAALGVEQAAALPAPDAPLQIPLDTTPTGVIRVASDGTASAEINAEAIQSRAAAENAASLGTGVPWGTVSTQEPAAAAPPQIGYDTAPTGTLVADAAGNVAAETNADRINRRQEVRARRAEARRKADLGLTPDVEAAQAGRGRVAPTAGAERTPAAPRIGYDNQPTGTLVADQRGSVRPETKADVINRRQRVDEARREARRKADMGLTPDVEAAQARMVRPSDIVNPAGAPFKSKFAADRAARAAPDHQVVEVDGGWALRKPEPPEKAATVAGNPDTAGAVPAQGSTPNVEVAQAAAVPEASVQAAEPQAAAAAGAGPTEAPAGATERAPADGAAGAQARLVSDWWAGASPADREAAVVRAGYARDGKITGIGKRIASRPWEDVATTVRAKIKAPEAAAGEPAQPAQQAPESKPAADSAPDEVWNGVHGKGMLPHAGRMQLAQKRKQRPDLEWSIVPAPEFGEDRIKLEGRKRSAPDQASAAAPPAGESPAFARAGQRSGSADRGTDVDALARRIAARWTNAPEVVTVESLNDPAVPEAVRAHDKAQRSQGATGEPEGFFYGGKMYLVAGQLKGDADVVRVLFHEALGHYGLRGTFGDKLGAMLDRMAALNVAKVKAKAAEYGLDYNKPADRRVAAEEVLAEMAQRSPELGWVKQAVAAIRNWLRVNVPGLRGLKLTDADIVQQFILPARRFVQQGSGAAGGQAAFSRGAGSTIADKLDNLHELKLPAGYMLGDLFNRTGKVSWWHKSVGTMHNLAERSPGFKKVYDAAQNFINDVSSYANDAADLAPSILPKLETWRDLAKSPLSPEDTKALSAPVFEGTLAWTRDADGKPVKSTSASPGPAGLVWTDAELRSMFKLNDKQIGLYREFRAATDRSLNDLGKSDMVRFAGPDGAEVREQVLAAADAGAAAKVLRDHLTKRAESSPDRADVLKDTAATITAKADRVADLIAKGYAPLSRFGSYSVYVTKGDEQVFFGLYESRIEATRAARRMRAEFPDAKVEHGTMPTEAFKLFAGVSPETLELFGEMLGLEAQGDAAASQAFQTYLKLAKNNRSAMRRLIERKGVAGFSDDAGRVLAGFVYSNARQTSQNLHASAMTRSLQDLKENQRGEGELFDTASKLVDYIRNPKDEGGAFRGLLFAQYLGGNVASAIVNATQPLMVTLPYLSQYGGAGKAAKQMASAVRDALKRSTGDDALDAALKRAESEGIVSPQEVHHLMAQAAGRGKLQAGDGTTTGNALASAGNAWAKFSLAWGKVFSVAEQFNRRSAFIAGYRTAVEQGMPDPAGFAERVVTETQFSYTKAARPQWARGAVGGTLFTFKTYSISYVELLHRMWTQGGSEGKRATLLALGMLFLVGGADGLPGADDLDDVIDGAMQRMGYNFSSKQARNEFLTNALGAGGAQFVSKGISGLPGVPIDVSGRMGLGNLIPGTGLLTKKQDHSRDMLELAGPAGDFAKRTGEAAGLLIDGESFEAAKKVAPIAARNMMKAFDMAVNGMYRDDKGRKVIDTDGYEAAMKAIGFQPSSVAQVQDAAATQQQLVGLNRMRESEIAGKWAQGMFEQDPEKIADAQEMLRRWNDDNPDSPIRINRAQLLRRVKEMRLSKADRIEKTAPREIRAAVRRELKDAQ